MWELIRANRRKSAALLAAIAACLGAVGASLGWMLDPSSGPAWGALAAAGLFAGMTGVSFLWGESLLLSSVHARPITHDVHPQLYNIVEEMRIAAGLPVMPRVFLIEDSSPNAFAAGLRPERWCVAVTTGLLTRLNRDELQGVIAHEMSHIANRDVLFVTLAASMLGSVQILSDTLLRGVFWGRHGSSSRRTRSGSSRSAGGGVLVLAALAVAILGPLLARVLYFALSRKREYLADACAVRLTRYPEGLASALEKISSAGLPMPAAAQTVASMFIVNPFEEVRAAHGIFSTHPPASDRIRVLRSMAGAGLGAYADAYARVRGASAGTLLPASALESDAPALARGPSAPEAPPPAEGRSAELERVRESADLARAANHFAFFPCACGLKIKVPPDFRLPRIPCPRCGLVLEVPFFGPIGIAREPLAGSRPRYVRRTNGWESFFCTCGQLVQLSPVFRGPAARCSKCGRETEISGAAA